MSDPVRAVLVSHFHWDREWYRTFEAYRGRLVDAVDRVLDLAAADPAYRFVLDGQAVLLEDYLAVRPARREALARGLRDRQLAAGPWYVQPDVLLPSGEALVRNLLLGRAVVGALGPVARTGYVPDSFGHPAQLPQLLAGFGIERFVHWRGSGNEIDRLGGRYRWIAPDGGAVDAVLLPEGYFNAACLPVDADEAAHGVAVTARRIAEAWEEPVILMNGFDHMPPDAGTAAVCERLGALLGAPVEVALLDDAVDGASAAEREYRGELLGARLANLLPGVWSTRMDLKLRNRACEALLEGWAEPWAALGRILGLADERPSLRMAWRAVVQNQAHDSICGCSLDAVAERVRARFDEAHGLAEATLGRVLDRVAGQASERTTPWSLEQEIVVFNPSPHPRTDVVRVPLDPYPAMRIPLGLPEFPPLLLAASDPPGFLVDGGPVRVVPSADPTRARWLPGQTPFDVELVARDVPPFGVRRHRLVLAEPSPDEVDDAREIAAGDVRVRVREDGALDVRLGAVEFHGLAAIEDEGDRGDSYDFDPVGERERPPVETTCVRRRHASGLQSVDVRRVLRVPRRLDGDRESRSAEHVDVVVAIEARVAPGVPRVDLRVRVENAADDHRLRLLFPTGRPATTVRAASTFDVVERATGARDATRWLHPAPATFPHQGFVAANGLMVIAPGLPEAEATADGTIAVTLVRAIGWIARYDLRTRPVPAGPPIEIPGAQMHGTIEARLALVAGDDPVVGRDAELGLRGAIGGPSPHLRDGASLLALDPPGLVLSAVKPAEDGDGIVVRVLNPTDRPCTAHLRTGFPLTGAEPVRLDETRMDGSIERDERGVRFEVPPRALRSVRLVAAGFAGTSASV